MNSRYVLVLAVLVLIMVGEMAGEGGPIDSVAQGESPLDSADSGAPARPASASPPASSDFFSDYEAETEAMPALLDAPSGTGGASRPGTTARTDPSVGALSKEQLNVEEPLGLASMREELR